MSKTIIVIFICFPFLEVNGQDIFNDSLAGRDTVRFKSKSLIIPTVLISYGAIGLTSPLLKDFNNDIKTNLIEQRYRRIRIDDYTQYAPALSVYALNGFGIRGKNNLKDRTIIMTTAYIIMGSSVNIIKNATNVERPDRSNNRSFPSGHTATAFLGAEFLFQEYKDVSVWYGVAGYVVAAGTGFLRMTNNKHWFRDVATGAGIGILSTKIAYWIHPFFKRTIFKEKHRLNGMIMPFTNGKQYGLGLTMTF